MLEFNDIARASWGQRTSELWAEPVGRSMVRVETELLGNHHSRGTYRGHTVEGDEAEAFGGSDAGPSPLAYFLLSLGFCEQAQVARNAALADLKLESVATRVRGYFDPRPGYVEGLPNLGFEEIRCEVRIESPEPAERILELMVRVEQQCYVLNTLRRCCTVHHRIHHNGAVLRDVQLDDSSHATAR